MSTVGNSVKTILSRMSNVAAGKEIDEAGESLNDVEKTLNRVGIALRDGQGNWYDFYDVLDTIASKWDTFSDVQQSQITTALGGTRQRENILVALENWDLVKKYAETGANSAGTAMEKYDIVLEGVAAKQEQLNAKTQEFYNNILSGGFLAGLLDVSNVFMDIVNWGDSFIGRLLLISTATLTLTALFNHLTKSGITSFSMLIAKVLGLTAAEGTTITATTILKGLLDTLKAHPVIFALSLITTAVVAIDAAVSAHEQAIQETIDKANELTDAYRKVNKEFNDNINSLTESSDTNKYKTLQDEFDELCKGVDKYGNNLSLTNTEYERYKSICEQIVGLNPDLMDGYDSEVEAIGNRNNALKRTIELLQREARERAKEYVDSSDETLEGAQNQYDLSAGGAETFLNNYKDEWASDTEASGSNLLETLGAYQVGYLMDLSAVTNKTVDEVISNWSTVKKQLEESKQDIINSKEYGNLTTQNQKSVVKAIDDYITHIEKTYVDGYNEATDIVNTAQKELANSMDDTWQAVLESSEKYDNLDTDTQNWLSDYVAENFDIDENTTEATKDKYIKTINEILDAISGNTTDAKNARSGLKDLLALDPNDINYDDYKNQVDKVVDLIAKVTGQDKKKVKISLGFDTDDADDLEGLDDIETKLASKFGTTVEEVEKKLGGMSKASIDALLEMDEAVLQNCKSWDDLKVAIMAASDATDMDKVFSDYADDVQSLSEKYEILTKAQEEYNEYGNITASTMKKIIDNDLLEYLSAENGQLQFNIQKLQENTNESRNNAIAKLQEALFTDLCSIANGTYQQSLDNTDSTNANAELQAFQGELDKTKNSALTTAGAISAMNSAMGTNYNFSEEQKKQADAVVANYNAMVTKVNAITSNLSSGSYRSKSNSGKSKNETEFDNLKKQFDADEISIDTYISKMATLLKKAKKGSDEYEKIKKELNAQKLNRIENQFDRGEITIDQYISKLINLRKEYKKNTEGYKELTQQINEQNADKYADQYERGEISLSSYIKQLTKLRDSYKKNSEEWKKYNDLINDTKSDAITNQYERGEITTDQYIDKLVELRKNYKKNSEEYKELTQTINETKADKYADQYERGEISLAIYIKRLASLRDSYKKNSEKWKEYNDLINDTNLDAYADMYERGEISATKYIDKLKSIQKTLDKDSQLYKDIGDIIEDTLLETTEKWIESQTEAIEELDRQISELGEVNTDKERVKYAELLGKKYKTNHTTIETLNKKLKSGNLTLEEKKKLQEKINELTQDEVNIRDEIENGVREYYENQKEEAELEAENAKKKRLYDKEVELYGSKGKSLYEYETQKKIDNINAEIEAKRKEKEAQDEINEREELQNNLIEARLKLQNALNNKTTKILKKQADGTWQYEYSANMSDVKDAQQGVKDAEKALDDFDWEQGIQGLEDSANELQETMDNLASQYEDEEFWANRDYEASMNSIAIAFSDIDKLVQDWMTKYGGSDSKLTTAYEKLTGSNNTLMSSIDTLNTSIEGLNETVGSNGTIKIGDGVESFDTGGNIIGNGLIFAHDKERVLTAQQNASFEQFISKIPTLLEAINIAKFGGLASGQIGSVGNANNNTSSTVISKVECIFPNITTTDGLQKAILELPTLALQKK